jgi:hypothetical protein
MQLSTLFILVPALLAAALPAPANDILSEIQAREASPIAEAEPILYVQQTGYGFKREASPDAEAEAEPILYVEQAGYGQKREASPEAEAEAEPILYVQQTGYGFKRETEG